MASLLIGANIEVGTAFGSNITLTNVTKASEAVFTNSGDNELATGDIVIVTNVSGMFQLNDRAIRVKSGATATSFTAQDLDSTGFNDYVSGGIARKVTTWLGLGEVASGFNYPEPTPNFEDATPISAFERVELIGLDSAPTITIPVFADPLHPAIQEVRKASIDKQFRPIRFTLVTGEIMIANGMISGGRGFDGSAGSVATGQVTLKVARPEQWFAA